MDGASFTHKLSPLDQARAPRAMASGKPGQGFDFSFTGKGRNEGTGGAGAHSMTEIAYGKGVIAAEQYYLFVNILLTCFIKVPTQGGNFFYRMVILHRTV